MKVVAVGSKIHDMFEIEEFTAEAFEAGRVSSGWEYDGYDMIRGKERVSVTNVCVETEMSYKEYKTNYSGCRTKKDSYNKEKKTIVVYVSAY